MIGRVISLLSIVTVYSRSFSTYAPVVEQLIVIEIETSLHYLFNVWQGPSKSIPFFLAYVTLTLETPFDDRPPTNPPSFLSCQNYASADHRRKRR